ncbi:uncharacterized protein LOC125421289 isoform X2 [Ziziphus jujuba]|uniref:Uncharacterized protein LOC125421289 isoform X2 n=1 Tax=Ziziphus jujuba TaxID=326968 RepID=A0ABM3ICM2_ZIZJJ|nr:uncharacterized protein LOC125421289 isoform X2 [Ziziphus jujuba]
MSLKINTFLLILLLLVVIPLCSGMVEGSEVGINPNYSLHKGGIQVNIRKLLVMPRTFLDYDDAGANPRHDPRRKPGNGRNP